MPASIKPIPNPNNVPTATMTNQTGAAPYAIRAVVRVIAATNNIGAKPRRLLIKLLLKAAITYPVIWLMNNHVTVAGVRPNVFRMEGSSTPNPLSAMPIAMKA